MESSPAQTQSESSTATSTAAGSQKLFSHSASASETKVATHADLAGGSLTAAASHAAVSGTQQTGVAVPQDDSKPTEEHAASRTSSHGAAQAAVSAAAPVVAVQPASVDAASAASRTPSPAHLSAASAADHAQASASASTATSASDTFSELDRGSSLGTPSWTHAGGQHAEAGFEDPDLGWVGVRADLNTSGIHATLVPSSTDAAQTLSGHLAGLSSHLAEQQSSVASLSMASPGDGALDGGTGQRMQQGAEGNPQGSAPDGSQASSQKSSTLPSGTSTLAAAAESGDTEALASTGELRGTHISVMA